MKAWNQAEKGAPARQALIRAGWPAPAVAALPDEAVGVHNGRVVLPLRIGDDVVDVIDLADERLPRRRGTSRTLPIHGDVDLGICVANGGAPLFVTAHPVDYLTCAALVAMRGEGAVVGVSAVGGLDDILGRLSKAAKTLGLEPGEIEIWGVIPPLQWLDGGVVRFSGGSSTVSAGRIEWKRTAAEAREAFVGALDFARVRLASGVSPLGLIDPPGLWSTWADEASFLISPGKHRWRITTPVLASPLKRAAMLKAFAYRLPLKTIVEATHWRRDPRNGDTRANTHQCTDHELGDLISSWLRIHGIETWYDSEKREWAYWDRRLLRVSADADGAAFQALLARTAGVNGASKAGRIAIWQIKTDTRLTASGGPAEPRDVRTWTWSDLVGERPETRIALGDKADRVVVARPGSVSIERNARGEVLEQPPAPITWRTVAAEEWSAMLYERLGRWLTCEPSLRLLEVSWVLVVLLGRRLKQWAPVRPLLWMVGSAGSGKSMSLELLQLFVNADPDPFHKATPRALIALAARQPLFAVDNLEEAMREGEMEELLLSAFRGNQRIKMKMNTDDGIVRQRIEAWFAITSIEGGSVHEQLQRALFIQHGLEHGDPAHDMHDPLDELLAARGDLICGAVRVWGEKILPRLVGGESKTLATDMREAHKTHPLVRQMGTLATLSVVADVVASLDPRWGVGGVAALERWLTVLGERTQAMMSSVDPIGGAMQVLLDAFNAVDEGRDGLWQPLIETERVKGLTPVFAAEGGGVTLNRRAASKRRAFGQEAARWPVVIGWVGTYGALHVALHDQTRSRGLNYGQRIHNADVLARRMKQSPDWLTFSKVAREGRSGSWVHAWVRRDGDPPEGLAEVIKRDHARMTAVDP